MGLALGVSLLVGCGETSLVIGGDPERQAVTDPGASAGSGASEAAGNAGGGGAAGLAGGESGGAAASISVGGSGSSLTPEPDPYPALYWENERADARYCPEGGRYGVSCVHADQQTTACDPDAGPSCNACSCARPCGSSAECPPGSNGEPGLCVTAADGAATCFLACNADRRCPLGMLCVPYPNDGAFVCAWQPDDSSNAPVR